MDHPSFEIGAGNTTDARPRGNLTKLTYFQNAFGIDLAVVAEGDDFFVAGALAFFYQARAQPPDQGVEPEDSLDQHVQRGEGL